MIKSDSVSKVGDNAWIKKYFDPKFCSRVGKGPLVEATDKGIAKLVGQIKGKWHLCTSNSVYV